MPISGQPVTRSRLKPTGSAPSPWEAEISASRNRRPGDSRRAIVATVTLALPTLACSRIVAAHRKDVTCESRSDDRANHRTHQNPMPTPGPIFIHIAENFSMRLSNRTQAPGARPGEY